ncbi:MAG: ABC transporter permease [Planctomycetes bacterium]|nr:ABC transporter permease [Planctomycetota bacterium]
MTRVVIVRLILAVVTLLAVATASFFMQRIAPGGPFDLEREMPEAARQALEAEWRLDRPLTEQFAGYLGDLASWPPDLKRSMVQPDYRVTELILPRLAVSLSLGAVTLIFALLVGIPLGIIAALRRNRAADHLTMLFALVGISVPSFVLGPFLKWVFAIQWGLLPESRWVSPASMVLPVLSLSAVYIATIARLVRAGMIEVLDEDWIRTARAKGLAERRVILRHALPGALLPLVAWLGPASAGLAVGSVVIERVFDVPGLGNTFVDAAFNRDYTMVMATVLVYSALLIVMNLLSDLALMVLDPRAGESR